MGTEISADTKYDMTEPQYFQSLSAIQFFFPAVDVRRRMEIDDLAL